MKNLPVIISYATGYSLAYFMAQLKSEVKRQPEWLSGWRPGVKRKMLKAKWKENVYYFTTRYDFPNKSSSWSRIAIYCGYCSGMRQIMFGDSELMAKASVIEIVSDYARRKFRFSCLN
jgi:hypothetical protein